MTEFTVVCRNWRDDRVLPRFARYLAARPEWDIAVGPVADPRAYFLMGYFETQMFSALPTVPVASLFTHREEDPPDNRKAALYDEVASRVDLRVAMSRRYAAPLSAIGPTLQPPLPVEQDRFVPFSRKRNRSTVIGISGYTYSNGRKGEDLAAYAVKTLRGAEWRASGRGWPVPSRKLSWAEMPSFYQGIDVLACASLVEGGPMGVLEALACGVRVAVPRGVGILDEIPDCRGVERYDRGSRKAFVDAIARARDNPFRPEELRALVSRHTVDAWTSGVTEGMRAMVRG